jgi:hypothetical protein
MLAETISSSNAAGPLVPTKQGWVPADEGESELNQGPTS